MSLPQMKNLGMNLELTNDGCFVSSEILGIYREQIQETDGHLLFDLAEFTPRETAKATGIDHQEQGLSPVAPTDSNTTEGTCIPQGLSTEGLDLVGSHGQISTPNDIWNVLIHAFQMSLDNGESAHQFGDEPECDSLVGSTNDEDFHTRDPDSEEPRKQSAELSNEKEVEIVNSFPSYFVSDSPSGTFNESLCNLVPGKDRVWHESLQQLFDHAC